MLKKILSLTMLLLLPMASTAFAADECYSWQDLSSGGFEGNNCYGVLGSYLCCESWTSLPNVCDEYKLHAPGDDGSDPGDDSSDPSVDDIAYEYEFTDYGAVFFFEDVKGVIVGDLDLMEE
ncbi:MAG: hypothetical protein AAFV53_00560 [Myxococcota bacterium]